MGNIIKGPSTRELMQQLVTDSEGMTVNDRRDFLRKGIAAVGGMATDGTQTCDGNDPSIQQHGDSLTPRLHCRCGSIGEW